jgi:hypothetical protein
MSYHIRSWHPVEGDWFQVEILREELRDGDTQTITRIIGWALIEEEGTIERLEAICDQGLPRASLGNEHIAFSDAFFVSGADKCPTGETWLELYNNTVPSNLNVRTIPIFPET